MSPILALALLFAANPAAQLPDKTVVLTFDDAVKSHVTFVAPELKKRGFGATFFISQLWMNDPENFLSWEDVAAIHEMGFEIGNHTWTHMATSTPARAARLEGELALVEYALRKVGVPKPVSFAWPANRFCIEGVRVLEKCGYKLARRGMQPEMPYGRIEIGPLYEPDRHHRLLIPTTGDAYPDWTLEHFKELVNTWKPGQPVVLQFHGVPDITHPWVHTPQDKFIQYMDYLQAQGFHVIAMRDLLGVAADNPDELNRPADRYRIPKDGQLELPPEVVATRNDLRFWLDNMLVHHAYSFEEAAIVTGWDPATTKQIASAAAFGAGPGNGRPDAVKVLPYPGGRHPRAGFLDGAIAPHRGTKASIFPPWEGGGYAVLDIPEAIWQGDELIYLAHTHIPTYWDKQNTVIENIDWTRTPEGLNFTRVLPNEVSFGVDLRPGGSTVDMELWVENGTEAALTGLRAQVCVMLKEAAGFEAQSNDNKEFDAPVTIVRAAEKSRWMLMAFQHIDRCWGNTNCPCAHADPKIPDVAPGGKVAVRGRIWFYEGDDIDAMRAEAKAWAASAARK